MWQLHKNTNVRRMHQTKQAVASAQQQCFLPSVQFIGYGAEPHITTSTRCGA
jgi:hypothetical protein